MRLTALLLLMIVSMPALPARAGAAWAGGLETALADIDGRKGPQIGVYVRDLDTGESAGWRTDGAHAVVIASCAADLNDQAEAGGVFQQVGRAVTRTALAAGPDKQPGQALPVAIFAPGCALYSLHDPG